MLAASLTLPLVDDFLFFIQFLIGEVRVQLRFAFIAISAAIVATTMAPPVIAGTLAGKCLSKFAEIKAHKEHWKVFAANVANDKQACGWTVGCPVKDTAIAKAMSECRVSERIHPGWVGPEGHLPLGVGTVIQ